MNQKIGISIILNILIFRALTTEETVSINAKQTKAISILLIDLVKDVSLNDCCQTIKRNLSFTGQFNPSINTEELQKIDPKQKNHEFTVEQMKEWSKTYPFFVSISSEGDNFLAKLYDTSSLKVTKIHSKLEKNQEELGHKVSNELLKILTNKEALFGSKIVFCRERKKNKTDICIADYDGSNVKVITSLNTLGIGPRWNQDPINPLILFSEYTATNLRLMITDLKGNKNIATNFDGLNMLPAFSPDGKEAVVCLSAHGNSQIYRSVFNKKTKRREYVSLTHNKGTNISPTILTDGRIVFCSDYKTKTPQIYIMDKDGKNIKNITDDGFYSSPVYNPINNKIVFIKLIDGHGQIMCYDFKTNSIKQITNDSIHKEECSWSPCGNYVLFATEENNKKQLAIHSLLTGKRTIITDGTSSVTYPAWSTHLLLSKIA